MRGCTIKQGKNSWRIKYDVGADQNGKRLVQTETVRGTKKDAEEILAKRLSEFAEGRYVRRNVETVESYAKHWIENIAPASRAPISIERYKTLLRAHIIPGLGAIELQKLDGPAIESFYATRADRAPLTRHHIHALLGQILKSAVKKKKLARSPMADIETKPSAKRRDKIEV